MAYRIIVHKRPRRSAWWVLQQDDCVPSVLIICLRNKEEAQLIRTWEYQNKIENLVSSVDNEIEFDLTKKDYARISTLLTKESVKGTSEKKSITILNW